MRTTYIVKVETNKQEFIFRHFWLILPFQLLLILILLLLLLLLLLFSSSSLLLKPLCP